MPQKPTFRQILFGKRKPPRDAADSARDIRDRRIFLKNFGTLGAGLAIGGLAMACGSHSRIASPNWFVSKAAEKNPKIMENPLYALFVKRFSLGTREQCLNRLPRLLPLFDAAEKNPLIFNDTRYLMLLDRFLNGTENSLKFIPELLELFERATLNPGIPYCFPYITSTTTLRLVEKVAADRNITYEKMVRFIQGLEHSASNPMHKSSNPMKFF
jgi:hypothetical protein